MLVFRELNKPGFVPPDALAAASYAFKLKSAHIAALEAEFALLTAAGLATADEHAGGWPSTAVGVAKAAAKMARPQKPVAASATAVAKGVARK